VHLDVDFELAMPALRDFLGPMAKKIMRDSLKSLLQGIKQKAKECEMSKVVIIGAGPAGIFVDFAFRKYLAVKT